MSSNDTKNHSDYIKTKGKFTITCNRGIFSSEEIKLLETYGHWFEALANGTLVSFNIEQKQFIEVARMKRKPETDYEKVWFKYVKRKEIEAKAGSVLYKTPVVKSDTFYNRDMAKDLRKTMFKVMKERGKK